MKVQTRKGYDALDQRRQSTAEKQMSPWVFYPVMLVSSLVIFVSLALYVRSLREEQSQPLQNIVKDFRRAGLYSWLAYNYEGFTLKSQPVLVNRSDHTGVLSEKKIVCYYNIPSGNNNSHELEPSQIHADLCTHINIAFANIKNKTINIDERLVATAQNVIKLKQKNKNLKVLLSIGGSGNDNGYSDMVIDHASRKLFIRSIKSVLRAHKLDGVDLDWEFPAIKGIDSVNNRERQHFSQLLREIRAEYVRENRDYLLTIAAAAPQVIVDSSYDVDQINQYVDFVNIMTYDFHYYTTFTPFTGLNAPLYPRSNEKYYMSTLNINYTTHMYLAKGLDRDKIVIGVPTYGHSFSLVNAENGGIGSPAVGFGNVGSLGFVNYPQICAFWEQNLRNASTVVIYDKEAKVPYLYRGTDWISYDDRQSILEKANFIKENRLGGAMIYSLNADDFLGTCLLKGMHIKFPLSQSLKNALHYGGL